VAPPFSVSGVSAGQSGPAVAPEEPAVDLERWHEVYSGASRYPLGKGVEVVPLSEFVATE